MPNKSRGMNSRSYVSFEEASLKEKNLKAVLENTLDRAAAKRNDASMGRAAPPTTQQPEETLS